MSFTEPTIVTDNNLKSRSYVTFYFNGIRMREYHGKSINLKIEPNRATSVEYRSILLRKLQFELHKALDAGTYPAEIKQVPAKKQALPITEAIVILSTQSVLLEALTNKLSSDLSRTYKRDLSSIYANFTNFMSAEELQGPIHVLTTVRIEKFLSQFGSSGTYYMNKRRNLGVLFSAAGRLIDKPLKSVKETPRRKSKAKLHKKYEKEQIKPILAYLKSRHHNLYMCCLLTYGSWLRPHEEIRLLTKDNFKNDMTEVHLSGGENKGGKVRVVYIPDYIRKELELMLPSLGRNDNIFTARSQPFNESYFNTAWSRVWVDMATLGLVYEHQTIYSFRHTAAVGLYRKTKDVYLLQKLLGHSSIVVTLKYLRSLGELNTEELKNAAPQL